MRAEPLPASTAFYLGHLAVCSLAWGSSFLAIKVMDGVLPPLVVAACRGGVAALVLMGVVAAMGQVPLPRRDELFPWLVIGAFNGAFPNTLVAFALMRMDSGPAALLQSAGPLMTAVAAHLLFADERLNARSLLGVAVGLVGVVLLIGPKAAEGRGSLDGALAMLGVAACYAIGNLYTRTVRHHDPVRLSLGQQMFSTVIACAALLMLGQTDQLAAVPQVIWPVLALGTVCTALPLTVFYRMIVRVGPTRAALTGYTVPVVAATLGVGVLGERLTLWQVTGGLIAFFGVYLVALSKRKQA